MARNLMVVESPNKVKTLKAFLGADWEVAASAGHIRDLPRDKMGVDRNNFDLTYQFVPGQKKGGRTFPGGKERVARLKNAARQAETVWLATDPDREGEAIAWHLKEAMGLRPGQYKRITFDAVDKSTVEAAIAQPRDIDMDRVRAQEARRALDRLVGYTVSPLISDSLHEKLSAGRVQSPALRCIVDRERAIRNFKSTNHFGAVLFFDGGAWSANWVTDPYLDKARGERYILDRGLAELAAEVRDLKVIDAKSVRKAEKPPAAFTTSGLLRAASVSLRYDSEQTARIAQKLFENGHITYHRTDSPNLADETIETLRAYAQQQGLPLPDKPHRFKSKGDAQEAHEAIRPKHFETETIDGSAEEQALYDLIRKRAIASQLAPAEYKANLVMLEGENQGKTFHFKASGRELLKPGWRSLTERAADFDEHDGSGKKDKAADAESGKVPVCQPGESRTAEDGKVQDKTTKPPPRFTEASLIAELESNGLGRPSTYPAILKNLRTRRYFQVEKRKLVPTGLGEKLVDGLVEHGFSFINLDFTRAMEEELDHIAHGNAQYRDIVARHYQQLDEESRDLGGMDGAFNRGSGAEIPVDENGNPYPCPECGEPLRRIAKKTGGHFWGCTAFKSSGCKGAMDDADGKPVARKAPELPTDSQGNHYPCPECGAPMMRREIKRGRNKGGFFWTCTKPKDECDGLMDDDKGKPVPPYPLNEQGKPYPCQLCGAPMRRVRKGDGGYFWSCTKWKKTGCKGAMDDDNGRPAPSRGKGGYSLPEKTG